MSQWRLFDADVAYVSTAEFHADRPRARHLEEPGHRRRIERAAAFVRVAVRLGAGSVSDLGCGDGGLLSLLKDLDAWGYDFAPANAEGWAERGVAAEQLDVFGADRGKVRLGDVTVMTEVLEHLTDPHGAIAWVAQHSRFVVASSPWDEYPDHYDDCHAWAFNLAGYRQLVETSYRILHHDEVGRFQVVLGMRL